MENYLRELAIAFWLVEAHPEKEKIYEYIWSQCKSQ